MQTAIFPTSDQAEQMYREAGFAWADLGEGHNRRPDTTLRHAGQRILKEKGLQGKVLVFRHYEPGERPLWVGYIDTEVPG